MELQEWIDGKFEESETDYKIAGQNILYKNEESFLKKGVELLCDKLNPTSVLEFGFGKGWTATEFQRKGVTRHVILEPNIELYQVALTWKSNYSTNIDILNIWSWDYSGGETFDLVYDDREPVTSDDTDNHFVAFLTVKTLRTQRIKDHGEFKEGNNSYDKVLADYKFHDLKILTGER